MEQETVKFLKHCNLSKYQQSLQSDDVESLESLIELKSKIPHDSIKKELDSTVAIDDFKAIDDNSSPSSLL